MEKRGQAAMEFLMTYGWAILAAIIAIGVLAYFGVFNPGRLAGSQGILSSPFNVDAFSIAATGDLITIEVTQNLGESITLLAANAGFDGDLQSPGTAQCDATVTSAVNYLDGTTAWPSGTQATIQLDCSTVNWAEGDQVRADLVVTYRKSGSSLNQISSGSVRGVSQA